jgi:uncharacterized membrane protein YjgN (DUF898 family)
LSNDYPDIPELSKDAPTETVEHRLQFTGSGSEYFRIWIVNLLLSILTLGIYSAWAKVRREQYFHRNTVLDGSGFDYHGDPKAILKGRIIAVTLLLILAGIDNLVHSLYYPALLLLSPLLPWMLIRSFTFRARNTSFRGLHFDFRGTYWKFCKVLAFPALMFVILGWVWTFSMEQSIKSAADQTEWVLPQSPENAKVDSDEVDSDNEATTAITAQPKLIFGLLVAFVPIYLIALIPVLMYRIKFFQLNHLKFGASAFSAKFTLADFYAIYLKAIFLPPLVVMTIGSVIALGLFVFITFVLLVLGINIGRTPMQMFGIGSVAGFGIVIFLVTMCYIGLLIMGPAYLRALIANRIWSDSRLDEQHGFVSDQRFWGLCKVILLNWLLMMLTLGLYWPWAQVRLAAYRTSHTAVLAGNLDGFIAGATYEQGAVGEEVADIFDFDIGF